MYRDSESFKDVAEHEEDSDRSSIDSDFIVVKLPSCFTSTSTADMEDQFSNLYIGEHVEYSPTLTKYSVISCILYSCNLMYSVISCKIISYFVISSYDEIYIFLFTHIYKMNHILC